MNTLVFYRKLASPDLYYHCGPQMFTDPLLQGHMGVEASWLKLGTATPLGGLRSKAGAQMKLSAFGDAGSHLAMGHSESKLLFYINNNELLL